MKLILDDFLEVVIARSGLKTEAGAPRWAKWIDRVDTGQPGGYAFVGGFIGDGTVEIDLGDRSRLILTQASIKDETLPSGWLRQFRVLILHPNGDLKPTHVAADDRQKGWAYRIRDLVINLLEELDSRPEFPSTFSAIEPSPNFDAGHVRAGSSRPERSRSVFQSCHVCGATLLFTQLTEQDNLRLCPKCARLLEAIHTWASSTRQHPKAAEIINKLKSA